MPYINIDTEMKRTTNTMFLEKAILCEPVLYETIVKPVSIVEVRRTKNAYPQAEKYDNIEKLSSYHLKKGDKLCLDFGDHQVGYLTLKLSSVGSPQDAPAYFKLKFGEIAKELTEYTKNYDGWISQGWIQEEFIHVDVLPVTLTLPRRYAFRFLEITVIDTSLKWQMVVEEAVCRSVSAVRNTAISPIKIEDEIIQKIDRVSLRTLQNCMQSVFEDGPKRDRRLWLGDLRLQAMTNYSTFRNMDLVKRCLYLFGGLTREDGKIGACLFTQPDYIVDDTFFFDYSLFFVVVLYDYYMETKDIETLNDLWGIAFRQIELAEKEFNKKQLIDNEEDMFCFIDWTEGLDKQTSAQGVYIYCVKRGLEIAKILRKKESIKWMEKEIQDKTQAARTYLWDEKEGLFVSGKFRQISYASQVWMVLAEVVTPEEGERILRQAIKQNLDKKMVSPYMNHHFTEALLICGMKKDALDYLKYYWGGMIELGADTFWELYNPKDPDESPYGSSIVNSYCHAWSCTPAYLLRKYFQEDEKW